MTRAAPFDPELDPPLDFAAPAMLAAPILFSSPHSGTVYSKRFVAATRLDAALLRRSEDCFIDDLFGHVVAAGMPLLKARFPRAYVDVNREPYELDPRMFDGRLPSYANTRSLRVASGLGTIPRVVGEAREIYPRRLPVEEALARIEQCYKPFHAALKQGAMRIWREFGTVVIIDCHSMPSIAIASTDRPRADIVLGDRHGTSCAGAFVDAAEAALMARGYSVVRNRPYAGGFITEHYGNPSGDWHALQIEINRGLYMDEARFVPNQGFPGLAADLAAVTAELAVAAGEMAGRRQLAAE